MKKYSVRNSDNGNIYHVCCEWSTYTKNIDDVIFATDDINIAYRYAEHRKNENVEVFEN